MAEGTAFIHQSNSSQTLSGMEDTKESASSGFSSFIQRDPGQNSYRNTAILESSDDSDSSDDDIWNPKRSCHHTLKPLGETEPFVNPNFSRDNIPLGPCSPRKKVSGFKRNNIWGSIVQEQSVTEGLARGIQVDNDSDMDKNNVEAYNYKNKFNDHRPDNNDDSEEYDETVPSTGFTEQETFGNVDSSSRKRSYSSRTRSRNVKERVGKRTYDKNKERPHITVTASDSIPKIVNELVNVLNEPKVDLMTRVVETLGAEKSLELLYMTDDIEDAGGLMVNDGGRRRTPGGVFLYLLRADANIEKAKIIEIFKNERDTYNGKKKKRQNAYIQRQVDATKRERDMEVAEAEQKDKDSQVMQMEDSTREVCDEDTKDGLLMHTEAKKKKVPTATLR